VVVLGDEYLASHLTFLAPAGALTVIDTHNAASRGHWRVARTGPGLGRRLEYACLAINTAGVERRFYPAADELWAVSPDDAEFFRRRLGRPAHVVPNVVDVPEMPPDEGETRAVTLTGSYAYAPSEEAALRLICIAAPLLRGGELERLTVVGRGPTPRMRALASATPGVELTGPVPTVVPYLRAARVFAAPIASGAGTKLKVLEAMAQGRAVITTPLGAEGIAIAPGIHAEVVPLDRFGEELSALVRDPVRQARLGRAAHHLVAERYSREAMRAAAARYISEALHRS
jgi:glycosyltransferase involved in cell wall biosynthesis